MGYQRRLSRYALAVVDKNGTAEGIRVTDLQAQSPPFAITLGEMIGANDPKATAT